MQLRPGAMLTSFMGVVDIKIGSEVVLLFGVINKVAGVYGLISVFTGGSVLQIAFYLYSVATLFGYLWGIRALASESSKPAQLVSHLYALDHAILTLAHYAFAQHYWNEVPHDGRRIANSQAQQDLIQLAVSRGEVEGNDGSQDEALRAALAQEIWKAERGTAAAAVIAGWFLKLYFIFVLYSYAGHLRSSTYHSLPLSSAPRKLQQTQANPNTPVSASAERASDENWE